MKTARCIRQNVPGYAGIAHLYKLSSKIQYCTKTNKTRLTSYVIVSAAIPTEYVGPETFIFPANRSGKVIGWHELPGSLGGDLDHARAIKAAGYKIISSKKKRKLK